MRGRERGAAARRNADRLSCSGNRHQPAPVFHWPFARESTIRPHRTFLEITIPMPSALSLARPVALRCEHLENPVGLDEPAPRFSWQMRDARPGARQTAYEIVVTHARGDARRRGNAREPLWSSGRVASDNSLLVPYAGAKLQPHTRYEWRVRLQDHAGAATPWSAAAQWTTGFLGAPWPAAAKWIGLPVAEPKKSTPVRYLRTTFELNAAPVSAHLYVTALGIFEAHLNGGKVGADVLTPGWTDYRRRVESLAYDVTAQVAAGRNALGLLLADGWYAGKLVWHRQRRLYGPTPAARAVLRLVFADGSVQEIVTGRDWKAATGAWLAADLYDGEMFDARRDHAGWTMPDFDDAAWSRARTITSPAKIEIDAKHTPPIRAVETLRPRALTEPAPGRFIFDLGQNMVGTVRVRLAGLRAGTHVTLRYGEMLQADGSLYTANLRSALGTDTYIAAGRAEEIYEPRFTFHGFRYVELSGVAERPTREALTAFVWQSDLPPTGVFSCSDPLINRLQKNIRWGQRGNYLDLPSDCPQRDERLGWTGDAQIFIGTAAFNYGVATFFRKWCRDLRDGQKPNGSFPDVAPDALALAMADKPEVFPHPHDGNAAWGDAGAICPWAVYQRYGDTRILAENYRAMTAWIRHLERTSRRLVRPDTAYGDWLATDAVTPFRAPTPCDLIGTAYFAESTRLVAATARVLGHRADIIRYERLHERIVAAFRREYVTPQGRIAGDTQTGYLLALAFDFLPASLRPRAVERLVYLIGKNGDRLATGFVGTPLLCPVLSRFGRDDVAFRLLKQRAYPSWLYPIVNGATTMWERWNSWTKETGFGDVAMNSFNHYAYGAVGEWMYRTIGGIDFDHAKPAFKHLRLAPVIGGGLTRASAAFESPHGAIRSGWELRGKRWVWRITVPPNTTATLRLPTARATDMSLRPPAKSAKPRVIDGRVEIDVAAGAWEIAVRTPLVVP